QRGADRRSGVLPRGLDRLPRPRRHGGVDAPARAVAAVPAFRGARRGSARAVPGIDPHAAEPRGDVHDCRRRRTSMTETEKRNLERVKVWEKTWNEDVMRMVDEVYAEDCEVRNMISGFLVRGREQFREVERAIQTHSPDRRMRVTRTIAQGDVVAL